MVNGCIVFFSCSMAVLLLEVGDYAVNINDEARLGRGSFGTVYPAQHKDTKQRVAAKCAGLQEGKGEWDNVKVEIDILQRLSNPGHPNILCILAHYQRPEENPTVLWIITELCSHGTLDKYFTKNAIDTKQNLSLMEDISSGLSYLHKHKIVHRDMKSMNVLIKDCKRRRIAKISDFGEAKFKDTLGSTIATLKGTRQYMAPEVISSLTEHEQYGNYRYPVDTFGAGITMHQMMRSASAGGWIAIDDLFSMPPPFERRPVGFVSWKKRKDDWKPISVHHSDSEIDTATKRLLIDMVSYDPDKRPSMAEVEEELQRIQRTHLDTTTGDTSQSASRKSPKTSLGASLQASGASSYDP